MGTPSAAAAFAAVELAGVIAADELGVAVVGGMAGATGVVTAGMLGGDAGSDGAAGAAPPAAALTFELVPFACEASEPVGAFAVVGAMDGEDGLLAVDSAFGFELPLHPIAATRQRLDTVYVNLFDMSHLEVSLG